MWHGVWALGSGEALWQGYAGGYFEGKWAWSRLGVIWSKGLGVRALEFRYVGRAARALLEVRALRGGGVEFGIWLGAGVWLGL